MRPTNPLTIPNGDDRCYLIEKPHHREDAGTEPARPTRPLLGTPPRWREPILVPR
jgi:hypothetical protein